MIKIGDFEIVSVVNGTIRLDGGAMFGIVPKVMWQNITDVDSQNRILLATRTLIAVNRKQNRVFLVDTGCGAKWTDEKAARYGISHDPKAIPNALQKMGLTTQAVTDVVITHLHFDHNGGLTNWVDDPDGPTELRYPDAKHWVHRTHWNHARKPYIKDRASFIKDDFQALESAGVLNFVEGKPTEGDSNLDNATEDGPIAGLNWFATNGHTPAQLHPIFSDGSKRLVFSGDIIPTVAHLRQSWVMAYDVEPLETIAEKERLCSEAIQNKWIVTFPHDLEHGGVLLDGKSSRPVVSQAVSL